MIQFVRPADLYSARECGCTTLRELLTRRSRAWTPDLELSELPVATQQRAFKRRKAMTAYYEALDAGRSKTAAKDAACAVWAAEFGEPCNEKTIRRLVRTVNERGGINEAPIEAYADGKSVPHERTRIENRLQIPDDFIAELKCRAVLPGLRGMRQAMRSMEIDWLAGHAVAGLGARKDGVPFPYKFEQLRKFMPPKAERALGNLGIAAARRDALPYQTNDWSKLRPMELIVLDDSRVDVIAYDDLTGKPVELRGYWAIDVATRRVLGFLIRQAGHITAKDVQMLLLRMLNSNGIAPANSGYITTILFERGTVACSAAFESVLKSLFPGRINIMRTGMDGGANFAGDYVQERSGHWQGKGIIESFMRTVAVFTSDIPGQRGGTYPLKLTGSLSGGTPGI
jgi:hypothetical protein